MPKFKTKLHQVADMNATGIVVPEKIVEALGAGKKPAVSVTIDGKYTYRGRVAVMGGDYMVGVAKEHRDKAGIKGDDAIEVEITLDEAPREVIIPPELTKALVKKKGAKAAFDKLSYTLRKEAVRQVETAKAEGTRARRIAKIINSLS
ncbi:MAG: YdeI/OmpD-associated family protein [Alphaproteobacteria bacterium]